jgi:hypothetical protein
LFLEPRNTLILRRSPPYWWDAYANPTLIAGRQPELRRPARSVDACRSCFAGADQMTQKGTEPFPVVAPAHSGGHQPKLKYRRPQIELPRYEPQGSQIGEVPGPDCRKHPLQFIDLPLLSSPLAAQFPGLHKLKSQ